MLSAAQAEALAQATHGDPFGVLGMHEHAGALSVAAIAPGADAVEVIDAATGVSAGKLSRVHPAGVFDGRLARRDRFVHRLRVTRAGTDTDVEDAYRFPPLLGEVDAWLFAEGRHARIYEKLGAHPLRLDGVDGVAFSVWAPSASRVAVVGDFNGWDARCHGMRHRRECGVWEIFVPGAGAGSRYKFAIRGPRGEALPLKADPVAFASELRPATASIVAGPMSAAPAGAGHAISAARDRPVSIYEVHAGSWRRGEGGRFLTWEEIGEQLVPYVERLGFTHVEFLPVMEHPFDGSWGYQPTALYAPTARHGTPAGFAALVRRLHAADIGVLLDWVPGHFPGDAHALASFDGTHLYEHADPRQGLHPDWNTLIYNFSRHEVRGFLAANALYWIERFGVDGLRVDAVASMLYLDYSRAPGQWVPNEHGGRENLDAVEFLRATNRLVGGNSRQAVMIAEESTAWPGVSQPPDAGGLGFHYKWNMGWMHDTLAYMRRDPVHRSHHHDALTFGLVYAFSENFVLPLSHDEVVHGKGSLLGKMPGDRWQRFANLRVYFGFLWTHPGKKLLFMGGEFGQPSEWNHDSELDWQVLDDPSHAGMQRLVSDLNSLYRTTAALHECDCEPRGFAWIDVADRARSVVSFLRRGRADDDFVVVVCNFTPVPRSGYQVGVPRPGAYSERLNTDSRWYGGSNLGNEGAVRTKPEPAHGYAQSLALALPPLACVVLAWTP